MASPSLPPGVVPVADCVGYTPYDDCSIVGQRNERSYPIVVYVLPFAFIVSATALFFLYLLRQRRLRERADRREREYGLQEYPMPKDAITLAVQSLPTRRFGQDSSSSSDVDAVPECRLCLEDYVEGVILRSLPCGHTFHAGCIDRWLAGNRRQGTDSGPARGERTCPICKREPLDRDCLQAAAAALHASRPRGFAWHAPMTRAPGSMARSMGASSSQADARAPPPAPPRRPYWRFLLHEVILSPVLPGLQQPSSAARGWSRGHPPAPAPAEQRQDAADATGM
jgi:hypothetical protein